MTSTLKNIILLALMVGAAWVAHASRPTELMAKTRGDAKLEAIVPAAFGPWRQLQQSAGQVVNPQQTELLDSLYSQILTRTYINTNGSAVMLSIAYGENQSDGLALHIPDVCYPAQGFKVTGSSNSVLSTGMGEIPVRRLQTELGQRKEPLTYWTTIGNKVAQGGTARKLEQLRYGFRGQIPDGLIFRVSSINGNTPLAYELQAQFISDLLGAMQPPQRQFLSGLN
ncbi:MAG: EpsI family protein [Rhodoferax sp.]|uniref:exosortase-associated protein EpsI, B-type n=1 Tax=Rhodoferax sp. TaxID=50421 RepID=UPI002ACEFE2D|nr:exosortase-associated protein EpsI, B-type [Rhodoferax sp.]MDZ7891350.1 EpsI family protein [Rhodoferax sp.]